MRYQRPTPFQLVDIRNMQSLVEHRSRFTLDHCELNVFETREKAEQFYLAFRGFAVTSMLRGKKIMHLDGYKEFEYVPGETVLAPVGSSMRIDFPEAELNRPTQCTALVLDPGYLQHQVHQINEQHPGDLIRTDEWQVDWTDIFLQNDEALARVSSRMLRVFTSNDPLKDLHAELIIKELVLCLLRLQYQNTLAEDAAHNPNSHPFAAVLRFIQENLTDNIRIEELCRIAHMSKSRFYRLFTDHTGMTPLQMIQEQRIRHAKHLLRSPDVNIKEVAYAAGFNDPNYFSRMFKKQEGMTPRQYRRRNLAQPFKSVQPLAG